MGTVLRTILKFDPGSMLMKKIIGGKAVQAIQDPLGLGGGPKPKPVREFVSASGTGAGPGDTGRSAGYSAALSGINRFTG